MPTIKELRKMATTYNIKGRSKMNKETLMKAVSKEDDQEEQDKENMDETNQELKVYLKARILKTADGFHKLVYNESTIHVNNLIEALVTRGKDAESKKKAF